MSKEVPKMTPEQVLEMEYALMAEYKKAEFQTKLHAAWKAAEGNQMEQMKKRQELTLPIQIPIITQYGFEASKKGVAQSTAAVGSIENPTDEMQRNHLTLMWLVDPDDQKRRPDFVPDAEIPEDIRPKKPKVYAEDLIVKGSKWTVVGGLENGGLLVRKGMSLNSNFYPIRLKMGARIQAESDVKGKRLHYRKLSGDGPDFGWVSLQKPLSQVTEVTPFRGLLVMPEDVDFDDEWFNEFAELALNTGEKKKLPRSFSPPEIKELMN